MKDEQFQNLVSQWKGVLLTSDWLIKAELSNDSTELANIRPNYRSGSAHIVVGNGSDENIERHVIGLFLHLLFPEDVAPIKLASGIDAITDALYRLTRSPLERSP